MADIFLSYAREDVTVASELVKTIREHTTRSVWWDDELRVGEKWSPALRDEIEAANIVLVLLSRAALASDFVDREVQLAVNMQKHVIGTFLEDIPVAEVPIALPIKQLGNLVDWVPGEAHAGLEKLLEGLDPNWQALLYRTRRSLYRSAVAALPLVVLVFLLMAAGGLDRFGVDSELGFTLLSARELAGKRVVHPDLVVLSIDNQTGTKLGNPQNWRALQADVLRKLTPARVVAYDFFFEPDPEADPAATRQFAGAIRDVRARGTSVVVAAVRREQGAPLIDPALRDALAEPGAGRGLITVPCVGQRWSVVASTVPLIALRSDPGPEPVLRSLALGAVESYWSAESFVDTAVNELALGTSGVKTRRIRFTTFEPHLEASLTTRCPVLATGDRPVRFTLDVFPHDIQRGHASVLPFEDVLEPGFDPERVRGKIVLVGRQYTELGSKVDAAYLWDRGPKATWGVNVHAAAINSLLSGAYIRRVGPLAQFAWLLVLAVLAAMIRLGFAARKWLRASLLVGLVAADLLIAVLLALDGRLSDVPWHFVVILASYGLAPRTRWAWVSLKKLLGSAKPIHREGSTVQ